MNIHILQHVHFEGEGLIGEWASKKNAAITRTKFYNSEQLPSHAIDLLVVMGGPMGIYDEEEFPWLTQEKAFIKTHLQQGTKILGVCLGAQLLADVLGAKVKGNVVKEIGWFPVFTTGNSHPIFKNIDKLLELTVFHWHGDTFDIPKDSVHLLTSNACSNQAFIYKNQAVGLQFHLEVTPVSLDLLIENGVEELIPGATVQTPIELKKGLSIYHEQCKKFLFDLLDSFTMST